jgi:hypothetical protein
MWFIPDDLQQGSITQEEPDALSVSLPRLGVRRRFYLPLYARLLSFLSPAVTRRRERKHCAYCENDTAMRCKKHGTRLCGRHDCTGLHRICRNISAEGSLTKDSCQFVGLNTWIDHLVHSTVVIGVGIIFAWLMVWL